MQQNNQLIVIKGDFQKFKFERSELSNNLYNRTLTSIENAFRNCVVDNKGWIWVPVSKLHCILRTHRSTAMYYIEGVDDRELSNFAGKDYIRGSKVISFLYKFMEEKENNDYLKVSKEYYDRLMDSDKVENLKLKYHRLLIKEQKMLKRKRILKYGLKVDELTGKILDTINSQFHHIRNKAIYVEFSDNINCGIIINKDVHDDITKNNIKDEDELYDYCIENKMNTDWYERFKEIVN
ncbi:hypothetical protein [Clostridium mediterraneense]|uniref:hypothetical protein n=1 Tax=Clostridium mediterraneense TaxID=1805472 RepID=UPI00082A1186|nr:hypothetical protein [Clostridium mediterraneense]